MAFLFVHRLIGQRVPFSMNLLLRHFCFLWHVKHLCMCVGGCLDLFIYLWSIDTKSKAHCQELQFFFRFRDCDSCIWKWYLECYCCHQWNMQVFISPHTTFELWAICSAVPKNVLLLIFGSGFVFCLTSRSQYLLFHVFVNFRKMKKSGTCTITKHSFWILLNKTEIPLAANTGSHVIIFKITYFKLFHFGLKQSMTSYLISQGAHWIK